jgi:hypothetical protein
MYLEMGKDNISVAVYACTLLSTRHMALIHIFIYEEFEDTKVVIRIRKSNDRQHNGHRKNYKKDKPGNNFLPLGEMYLEMGKDNIFSFL